MTGGDLMFWNVALNGRKLSGDTWGRQSKDFIEVPQDAEHFA